MPSLPARQLLIVWMSLVSLGCPPKGSVWLTPHASPWRPGFGIAPDSGATESIGPSALILYRCGVAPPAGIVWHIVPDSTGFRTKPMASLPSRVRFGDTPTGYQVLVPPERLEVGCYLLTTSSSGSLKFSMGADGAARAWRD